MTRQEEMAKKGYLARQTPFGVEYYKDPALVKADTRTAEGIHIENFGWVEDFNEAGLGICTLIVNSVFEKLGLELSRSEYNDSGFWAEHSPGTEDNWIDVFLSVQLFTGIQGESPGYEISIKLNSLDPDFPGRINKKIDSYPLTTNFSTIVKYVSSIISRSMKRIGQDELAS